MKLFSAIVLIACTLLAVVATAAETRTDALRSPSINVLAFKSETCYQCQVDKPKLAELRRKGVNVVVIDVDREPEVANLYDVTNAPFYIVEKDGVQIKRTGDYKTVITCLIQILTALLL